jgi:aspartyl-tRNA(Asn)/glutamyl-tRNA(Gln) amidotransferase subunit B
MNWEIVIGLETHTQLSTRSKIFSGASTAFGAAPNAQTAPVDLALPGTLPVLNRGAVERAIRFGLAVGATIAPVSIFARKNYFYPDLPKGYQISQYELPVVAGGAISFVVGQGDQAVLKTVQLTRAHLEEDAGKSLHEDFVGLHGEKSSGVDLNRAGTPLLEIVSEPDMRSAAEAVAYAKTLHALVMWLDICDGNMQEGSFRCDVNVSVRPAGSTTLGTRCEIKNLNSFRFMQQAIDFEVERQIALIEDGGTVIQQTRLYDPDRNETRAMRSKEDAHDYRYFPDPDLPPLTIAPEWIARVRATLPELPAAMRERLVADYGLSAYDAQTLTASKDMARYFDDVVSMLGAEHAKQAANWIMGDLSAVMNERGGDWSRPPAPAAALAATIQRVDEGRINAKQGKALFTELAVGLRSLDHDPRGGATVRDAVRGDLVIELKFLDALIAERGLEQISDSGALEAAIDEILAQSPSQLADYRAGKEKLFGYFVGQAMKATGGKANPQQLNALLKAKLAG